MVEPEALARCGVCGAMVGSNLVVQLGGKTVCVTCKTGYAREMAGARPVGAMRYAGFWIRVVAMIIDGLILGVPLMVVMFLLVGGMMAASGPGDEVPENAATVLVYVIFYGAHLLYYTIFHGKFGATPGKMAVKIKVVRSDGSPIGFGRAFGRWFGNMLSGLICYIGYIIAGFDPEKRALHDRICDTRVIYK